MLYFSSVFFGGCCWFINSSIINQRTLRVELEGNIVINVSKYPDAKKGDTVRVRVPDVDRGRTDGRNILAFVLEVTDANLYKLGRKHGILNQFYARNQFTICNEKFIHGKDSIDRDFTKRMCKIVIQDRGAKAIVDVAVKVAVNPTSASVVKKKSYVTRNVSGSCSNK